MRDGDDDEQTIQVESVDEVIREVAAEFDMSAEELRAEVESISFEDQPGGEN